MGTLRGLTIAALASMTLLSSVHAQVRPDRLWLPGNQASLRPLLYAAALKASEHPDCNDVLYGRLNEYRTEHTGTAFTILCMKDARTTFNLVYYAAELDGVQMPVVTDDTAARAELERLRQMLGQPVTATSNEPPAAGQVLELPELIQDTELPEPPANLPPPEIF